MPLVDSKAMLIHAMRNKYAVGAFNANNMEVAQAIIEAADEESSPVIIQISEGAIKYGGENCLFAIVKSLADKTKIPVVCHLDHGTNKKIIIKALRAGFTSLMFDGSNMQFDENISATKELTKIAHSVGIPLEGEIGSIPDAAKGTVSYEEMSKYFTTPKEAQEFFERTGVDSLAVSVGSAHRMKTQNAVLDIKRIKEIRDSVEVPLVLHGASGVKDEYIIKAVEAGINKINFATELNKAFTLALRQTLSKESDLIDIRKYGKIAKESVKTAVSTKIKLLKSSKRSQDVINYILESSFFQDQDFSSTMSIE